MICQIVLNNKVVAEENYGSLEAAFKFMPRMLGDPSIDGITVRADNERANAAIDPNLISRSQVAIVEL
jgi:hypothetical protein